MFQTSGAATRKLTQFGGGCLCVCSGEVDVWQNSSSSGGAVSTRLMTSTDDTLVTARTTRLYALRLIAVQRTMTLQLCRHTASRNTQFTRSSKHRAGMMEPRPLAQM